MNPLGIDVVVNNIFKCLSLGEIGKFRAVCKAWFDVANRMLATRINEMTMLFMANEEVGSGFIDLYLHMYEKSDFDFTNFKFISFPMGAPKTKLLFSACGYAIQKLTLTNVSITNHQLADLLTNQAPFVEELSLINLPNEVKENRIFPCNMKPSLELKKLTLDDDLKYSQLFIKDLLSTSHKLESLNMASNYDSQYQEHKILEILATEGCIDNIQKLKLSSVDDRIFHLLETQFKSCPLNELIIGYRGHGSASDIRETSFQTLINDHKDRWQHLEIGIAQWEVPIQFPEMRNLKFFSFGSRYPLYGHNTSPSFGNFDYGKMFPNLVTLNLYEAESFGDHRLFNLNELFPENSSRVLSLKNLELPQQLNRDILRRIGIIFPNVCKLNLSYQPMEVLTELWTTWPLIKILAISIFDSDCRYGKNQSKTQQSYDSIFTGISDEILNKLKNSNVVFDHSMVNGPSISNLQDLRHLIISDGPNLNVWQSWTPPSKITNATFRYALVDMKNLVCLQISDGIHKVSPLCLEETCSKLDLMDAEWLIGTQLVKYEWQKEQLKQPGLFLFRSFPDYA